MLKPFLHQIDYIGTCLFYGSFLVIGGVLIFAIATKTKLDFTEKLVEGQDVSEIFTTTRLDNVRSNFTWPLNQVQLKRFENAADIAQHGIGDAESRYSEALMYMRDYFPTSPTTTTYLKCKLRFMS
jgi:hypothetical protein